MTPRLTTSKTWTDLPKDFVTKLTQVFNDEFKLEAGRGQFLISGRIYPREVMVRLGYLENGRLKQINFEASMDLPDRKGEAVEIAPEGPPPTSAMDRLYSCIDALGSVMEEHFDLDQNDEDAEVDVPPTWRAYQFEGETVYLQQTSVNSILEEEADRLLALAEEHSGQATAALVKELGQSEDALEQAEIDEELAFEMQKAIREGRYKAPEYRSETNQDTPSDAN